MSKKCWPNLYSKLLYEIGKDFLDRQYTFNVKKQSTCRQDLFWNLKETALRKEHILSLMFEYARVILFDGKLKLCPWNEYVIWSLQGLCFHLCAYR